MAVRADPDRPGSNVRRKQVDTTKNLNWKDYRAAASLIRETRRRNREAGPEDAQSEESLFEQFTIAQLAEIRAVAGAQLAKQVQAKRAAEAKKTGRPNQPAKGQQPTAAQRAQNTKDAESLAARAQAAEERSPATAASLRGEEFTGEQAPVMGKQHVDDAMAIFKQLFADMRAAEEARKKANK